MCRRITGHDADAADATQEAMIAIVRSIERFDGRVELQHVDVPDRHERQPRRAAPPTTPADRRHVRAEREADEPVDPSAGGRFDAVVERDALDAALAGLPEDFRVPVVLRDVGDLDYAEIAEVLGVPIGTVKSRIARGRAALADALGGNRSGTDERPSERP